MPPQGPSRRTPNRSNAQVAESSLHQWIAIVFLAFLTTFTVFAAESIATDTLPIAVHAESGHRFVLFRNLRWYPMRPQSEAVIDNLTLASFVMLPLLTAPALKIFFRKKKSVHPSGWERLALGNALVFVSLLSFFLLLAEVR